MTNKTDLNYHLIIVTKYRKPILRPDIMEYTISIIEQELKKIHCEIIAINGDEKNHIHILLKTKPMQSISLIVKIIKQYSTYHVWQKFGVDLRRDYWYNNILWSSGYFCCSIGNASEETIKNYIENQGN